MFPARIRPLPGSSYGSVVRGAQAEGGGTPGRGRQALLPDPRWSLFRSLFFKSLLPAVRVPSPPGWACLGAPTFRSGGLRIEQSRPGRDPGQSLMILPQVHLRKPCYDFYFL